NALTGGDQDSYIGDSQYRFHVIAVAGEEYPRVSQVVRNEGFHGLAFGSFTYKNHHEVGMLAAKLHGSLDHRPVILPFIERSNHSADETISFPSAEYFFFNLFGRFQVLEALQVNSIIDTERLVRRCLVCLKSSL